jgi:FHS family L-fucose permease-like MFS transporter
MITPTDQNARTTTGLFRTADGKNYAFVFMLICSLFLLWGIAHALLDVLNKHFQNSLQVTRAQSGCVQAAVYGGYFLMAIPAGLVARRFGYKGGIILGLTLFALGAYWFVPATRADGWNGVTSWVSSTFKVEVVQSPEIRTKLVTARASWDDAGKALLASKELAEAQTAELGAAHKTARNAVKAMPTPEFVAACAAAESAIEALPPAEGMNEGRDSIKSASAALTEWKSLTDEAKTATGSAAEKLNSDADKKLDESLAALKKGVGILPASELSQVCTAMNDAVLPMANARYADAKVAMDVISQALPESKKLAQARTEIEQASQTSSSKDFSSLTSAAHLDIVHADQATQVTAFGAFLLGLFVIALGLTCLETIANPYTTVLGPPESGASRINLAQTCNALGWILGPLIGGLLIFSSTSTVSTSNTQLAVPYVGLGVVVTLILVMFAFSKIPDIHTEEHAKSDEHPDKKTGERSLWSQPHFVLAVAAQFLYVAAQTGVNSFFINYVVEENNWPERKAALLLSFGGMGLFMVGRFSGSFLMRRMKPHLALATYGLMNVIMMGLVVADLGIISAGALIACYFFMSVMFPTIFALGIRGLGENTKKGSSFIVMSIVGGAIAPILMGLIADKSGMQMGFIIPLVCFAAIMLYGFFWRRLFARDMGNESSAVAH